MCAIARNRGAASAIWLRQHAAADPAIRAGCADRGAWWREGVHVYSPASFLRSFPRKRESIPRRNMGPRFRGDDRMGEAAGMPGESFRGGERGCEGTLIHILLITPALLEVGHKSDRIIGGAQAEGRDDIDERRFDILGHVLGIAADINVRSVGKPGPKIAADIAHAILHVDL